ncbi:MAG: HesA/MoeB/ThiF family protein [Pirellulales bacterium]|jgi:molybdopterin/thiamine biosynthesis adenylyltransferase|nr:HesA/MoeB/ThiF family protein [Pirellulales bacterium]HJN67166.1 HesA/MoeB/ThiF family protein [Pirellulales bacterium]
MPQAPLNNEEKEIYAWQIPVCDFGEEGQERLKGASVLISRIGGLGGVVAYELAAAGIGHLILAHAGDIKPGDLNRQLLMTHDALGTPRIESAKKRLLELNPRLQIDAVAQNVAEDNAADLVSRADVVVDCAPLFAERYLLNRHAVAQGKHLIECSMYEMEFNITSIEPGTTPCLRCLFPDEPPTWKREFPVFGAVSGAVGCLGATEAIKILGGFGNPLYGQMIRGDLRNMQFQKITIHRDPSCRECGHLFQ